MRRLPAAVRRNNRRLRRTKQRRPLVLFDPSPALGEFYRCRGKRQLVLAANRVGKTRHAIAKLAMRLLEADRKGEPIRCRVMGPKHGVLIDTAQRYLSELLGASLAEGCSWNPKSGFGGKAITRGGSWVEWCTYKQDPETLESSSLHLVLLDEPPTPAAFDACTARLFDTDGELWVTLTAVNRPVKWLKELAEQGHRDGDWALWRIPLSKEACPWYSRAQIEAWKKDARRRPWSYKQRIEAAWEGTSDDRWFSGFVDSNLISARMDARDGWPKRGKITLILTADHGEGPGHSHWVLLGYQVVSRGRGGGKPKVYIRALAEWTNDRRMSVESEAKAVQEMVESVGASLELVAWGVGDHNVASKSETARTLNEAFAQEFTRLRSPDCEPFDMRAATKGAGSVDGQVATCNQLLDSAELYVSELCVHVVESLRHWAGKDDGLKHAADSLRYGVIKIVEEVGWDSAALAA